MKHHHHRRALWLLTLGLLLLGVMGRPALAEEGERGGPKTPQTPIPVATPLPGMPVIDRLAPPPTAAAPTQADDGAQLYWLHCQPCHGDVGQGLTDEWRAQYPPEDQYCWDSGCHGERPYENGFTLPFTVPAIIGDGTLTKYQTAGALYRYIQVAMPFWNPNSLTEEEYLAITAHLMQAHDAWAGTPLTAETMDSIVLPAGLAAAQAAPAALAATPAALPAPAGTSSNNRGIVLWGGLALAIVALAAGVWLWQRLNR
jgi:mono/diheme cytochrome c family protein